jgi:hypothetical protein
MSAIPMTTTDPLQRAVAFANVFTQAALDAAHAGITPQLISVDQFGRAPLTVDIQLGDRDTRAVDTLADLYGIAGDPGDPLLYRRVHRPPRPRPRQPPRVRPHRSRPRTRHLRLGRVPQLRRRRRGRALRAAPRRRRRHTRLRPGAAGMNGLVVVQGLAVAAAIVALYLTERRPR